jgi:hypothetical protein
MDSFIDKAFNDGHLRIDQSGRVEKVVYAAANRSERWSDPEEKVRAGLRVGQGTPSLASRFAFSRRSGSLSGAPVGSKRRIGSSRGL